MNPELSLVIPLWNEEGNVELLCERCAEALDRLGRTWEMILVDDGSTDGTWPLLRAAREREGRIRLIRMRTNFGQTAALAAGFDHARGSYVVTMDGDLQNDPGDIGAVVEKMDEGYQVVSGWRRNRKENFFKRRLPSMTANRMLSFLSGVSLHDYGCTLKGYSSEVAGHLHPYAEMHRFLPALASLAGARYTEIPVRDHPRHSGSSKYGISRVGKVFLDMLALKLLLHFSTKPRYWFGYLSIPCAILGIFFAAASLVVLAAPSPGEGQVVFPGAAFLFFYLGFYLFTIGWIAELISAAGTFRYGHFTESLKGEGL